jgi:signal transduction histidine kinase/CheY-like chemotaxis protein
MKNSSNTDSQYFKTAVFTALVSMAALILIHIPEYSGESLFALIIPVTLCAALLAVTFPLLGYIKRTAGSGADSGYYQAANLFAVFSMVSFILIRLPEYIRFARYFNAAVLAACCLLVIAVMMVLMLRVKLSSSLSFYIPAVIFVMYTLGTVVLRGTSYYFLTYLVICGIGAVYNSYKFFRSFVILSHLIILILLAAGAPLLIPGTPLKDILVDWILAAYTSIFFMMLSRFSSEKSSRSARALDTFDTLMAATPNLLAMVDEMNRVTYISRPLAELAHIEDYEMAAGRPVIDLFPDIDMKLVIGEIVEADGFYDGTVELNQNGAKRYFKIISDKFPGAAQGRFIDMSDVTPIMEARFEAEEAKARAEEANTAKSAFLARMSHEIRTPMNAIVGMSELILREDASPQVYEHAAAVKQAGNNLVTIINDILDFSKIESGKMEIVPVEYEFSSLINDVITIIRMRLREKPVYFVVNVDSSIAKKLYGDVVRVRQILLNLLSNAAKYTNEGHIILTVDLLESGEDSITLKFEITDTGIGIKAGDMGKLFGDFSQVDIRGHQGVEGTGLGLAIARSLCRAMGGDITVDSVYGEGSTFTAVIPQEIRDGDPFAAVDSPESKKALIYETREIYANSIVCSVDNLGVSCRLVGTEEEFVQALGEDHYDFIFAASFLFNEAQAEIRKAGIDTTLVLLAEYGEVIAERQVRFIAMPAYSVSIANILNGTEELRAYSENDTNIRFTAPEVRVLIVDDIKTNLDVVEGLLAPYAMQIDTCLSGERAIELVRENSYDLVLMDHMMPGMDGIEATKAIRALGGGAQDMPVIALTANALSGMRDMFLGAGFNDYISKPIEIVKLDDALSRWIPEQKKKRLAAVFPGSAGNSPAAGAPADPLLLRPIPGLDTARGLMMTGGTGAGYRKVLRQFCSDASERLPLIDRIPGEAELPAFTVNVHALKSAAGTVGAADVSAAALLLEAAGREGDLGFIRESLAPFCESLAALIGHITGALEDEKETGEPAAAEDPGAASALRENLESLRHALEAKSMKEIDRLLETLETLAARGEVREAVNAVSDKVLMSEFAQALEAVDNLLATAV